LSDAVKAHICASRFICVLDRIKTVNLGRICSLRIRRLELRETVLRLFEAFRGAYSDVFLLESVEGPEGMADYSFLGFNPQLIIEVWRDRIRVEAEGGVEELEPGEDPLNILKGLLHPSKSFSYAPRFIGGLVGYISYEASRLWEDLEVKRDARAFPLMKFGLFADTIVYDHRNSSYYYCSVGEDRLNEILRVLRDSPAREPHEFEEPRSNLCKTDFMEIVERAKEYIASGDIFQVVLSRKLIFASRGSLVDVYKALRRINPSPYMYYLNIGGDEIVGSSPEMLLRVQGDGATTFPIAGTRPRESDPRREERSDVELLNDEKEKAEHVMLVDLARNDLGKVAVPGTVRVSEFMRLVKYSHVKHLVSRVDARLRGDADMFDAFRAVFPAGTVSGAPKPRAMEIIDELEPDERGPYAGAVGYFSYNWCCDFAITIRSLVRRGGVAVIQAGAGIVWDSDPEREWWETHYKMMAVLKAVEEAGA